MSDLPLPRGFVVSASKHHAFTSPKPVTHEEGDTQGTPPPCRPISNDPPVSSTASLSQLLDALRSELLALAGEPLSAWRRAREQHALLEPFDGWPSLLEILDGRDPNTYDMRNRMLRALIVELQRSNDPASALWGKALTVCFAGSLLKLRGRLLSELCDDELDQLVLTSFWEAICDYGLDHLKGQVAPYLRQRTSRLVFRALREEYRLSQIRNWLIHDTSLRAHNDDPEKLLDFPDDPIEIRNHDQLVELLVEVAQGEVKDEAMQLVIETRVKGRSLREMACERSEYEAEAEAERHYQRLKRKRSRALQRLRVNIEPIISDVVVFDLSENT